MQNIQSFLHYNWGFILLLTVFFLIVYYFKMKATQKKYDPNTYDLRYFFQHSFSQNLDGYSKPENGEIVTLLFYMQEQVSMHREVRTTNLPPIKYPYDPFWLKMATVALHYRKILGCVMQTTLQIDNSYSNIIYEKSDDVIRILLQHPTYHKMVMQYKEDGVDVDVIRNGDSDTFTISVTVDPASHKYISLG